MSIYPEQVWERCQSAARTSRPGRCHAAGRAVNFSCGCLAKVSIRIDSGRVADVAARSNGCGYLIAACDIAVESVGGKLLAELGSLDREHLRATIVRTLGEIPPERDSCIDCGLRALRSVFANYRSKAIEEFRGEVALICTCFGVSEKTIEDFIESVSPRTTEEVTYALRAGGGCGSCLMLIQEMIDSR